MDLTVLLAAAEGVSRQYVDEGCPKYSCTAGLSSGAPAPRLTDGAIPAAAAAPADARSGVEGTEVSQEAAVDLGAEPPLPTSSALPTFSSGAAQQPPTETCRQRSAQLPCSFHPLVSRGHALLQLLDDWAEEHAHPAPGSEAAKAWGRLVGLDWCPVMVTAPEEGGCAK